MPDRLKVFLVGFIYMFDDESLQSSMMSILPLSLLSHLQWRHPLRGDITVAFPIICMYDVGSAWNISILIVNIVK